MQAVCRHALGAGLADFAGNLKQGFACAVRQGEICLDARGNDVSGIVTFALDACGAVETDFNFRRKCDYLRGFGVGPVGDASHTPAFDIGCPAEVN